MFYIEWLDKKLDEIFNTVTNEKGLNFLKIHPAEYEIFIIKEVERD